MHKNLISNFGAGMTQEQLGSLWDRMKTSSNDESFHVIKVVKPDGVEIINLQEGLLLKSPLESNTSSRKSEPATTYKLEDSINI